MLRLVGAIVFLAGAAATGAALRAAFARGRWAAAGFGLLAAVTVGAALAGLLLVFIPSFF